MPVGALLVACQAVDDEEAVVLHPSWPHTHVVWKPVYITGEGALEIDHQKQLFQTRAMAACQGSGLQNAALRWNQTWVMSLPTKEEHA